jgi:hypothetical protein
VCAHIKEILVKRQFLSALLMNSYQKAILHCFLRMLKTRLLWSPLLEPCLKKYFTLLIIKFCGCFNLKEQFIWLGTTPCEVNGTSLNLLMGSITYHKISGGLRNSVSKVGHFGWKECQFFFKHPIGLFGKDWNQITNGN